MTITDEAVEAAAKAHQAMRAKLGHPQWDELNEMGHRWRLHHMRASLAAAAPHLHAEWEEARKAAAFEALPNIAEEIEATK